MGVQKIVRISKGTPPQPYVILSAPQMFRSNVTQSNLLGEIKYAVSNWLQIVLRPKTITL